MHPLVPIIMALGAILFLIGIIVQAWFGVKRTSVIKLRGKEYKIWQFVAITVGSGVALFMLSVLLPKYMPYEPEKGSQLAQPTLPGNLKYELDSILASLNIKNDIMLNAIDRFQVEYQAASQKGDKNTMDLLALEIAYRIRTELQNLGHAESRIERDVEGILGILKQPAKPGDGK